MLHLLFFFFKFSNIFLAQYFKDCTKIQNTYSFAQVKKKKPYKHNKLETLEVQLSVWKLFTSSMNVHVGLCGLSISVYVMSLSVFNVASDCMNLCLV